MEAIFSWMGSLANNAFPIMLVAGLLLLITFPWAGPMITPILPPDKLRAYSILAVVVGSAGTLTINSRVISSIISERWRKYREQCNFEELPLHAKFSMAVILANHTNEITVPSDSNATSALIDAGYVYVCDRGVNFIALEFYSSTIESIRKRRSNLFQIINSNIDAAMQFKEQVENAEAQRRKHNETSWMRL